MVEQCFAEPTEQQIERGAHRWVRALETAGMASVEHPSHDPRPCEWARAADRTLAVVKRFRERVSARSDRVAAV
jgi:hypothetical protein